MQQNQSKLWDIVDGTLFESDNLIYGCDRCGKELCWSRDKWYHLNVSSDECVDYCVECGFDSFKRSLDRIDRIDFNNEEKPLVLPCKGCGIKMGGGFEWYSNNNDFDVCMECYHKPFSVFFPLVDRHNYCRTNRSYVFIQKAHSIRRIIPTLLESEANESREKDYSLLINNVASLDLNFGPYNQWIMFTDLCELKDEDAESALLVNCGSAHNGQVAALVGDDHGRVGITVVYDSLEDYLVDYKKWQHSQEANKSHTEFSRHIVVDRDLRTYFG